MVDSRARVAPRMFRLLGLSLLVATGWFALSLVLGWGSSARATEPAPLGDVTGGLSSVVGTVSQVTAPVVEQVVAPVAAPPVQAVAPVVQTVAPVVTRAADAVPAPVVAAVTPVVAPVAAVATPIVAPIVAPLAPVVAPVIEPLTPAIDALVPVATPMVLPTAPVVDTDDAGVTQSPSAELPTNAAGGASASSTAVRTIATYPPAPAQRLAPSAALEQSAGDLPGDVRPARLPHEAPAVAPTSGGAAGSSTGSPPTEAIPASSALPPRAISVSGTASGSILPASATFDTDTSPD
jgi:hypothetical protein